ncbi:MAG: FAD-dependent oxidoreductase, partial [Verrucomicrobiota bacterium]
MFENIAKADQEARNRTWQTGQAGAAETLFQVPPDPVVARQSQPGPWPGAGGVDLNALKPAEEDFIYVLGGCAELSRDAAAALMRPLNGIALGHRVGAAAAKLAQDRTDPIVGLKVAGTTAPESMQATVGEMLNGLRANPVLSSTPTVKSPARSIPVLARIDTVVIGGGTGGGPAGIGAARGGARTVVIEYLHGLGGVGTLGRISKYYHGNRVGFTAEVDQGVIDIAAGGPVDARRGWNIENKMEWLRSEIVKAGGDVWFQCLGIGSLVKDNRFVGAVVATPFGRGAILAHTVIDATGNAVLPACAGLETQEITGEHVSVQGTGLPPFTPGESYKNSDWTFTDDDDVLDMWRIHVVGRKKYRGAFDTGQLIDTRARRRIVGDILVSPMDIINQRVYPDVITISKSNFDNHGFSSHSLFMITPPDKRGLVGNVPYRSLLPKGQDGILVTGLGMSAHGDAMPVMRMQADVQNQGYAAGKASAMAAEEAISVRTIDVTELQKHLVDKGVIPKSMVGAKDSYPIGPEQMNNAVKSIGRDYSGIAKVLTDPELALPLLRQAYTEADDEAEQLRYAHVLGMLFDDTGTETLMAAVDRA